MPTITLNKKVFEKLVGTKLPPEKLKEKISYLGTDLESIEGDQIVVEIFPNRPDMLSEQGFARAFSSFIGRRMGLRKYSVKKSDYSVIIDRSVEKIRPFTACAVVKNIKFDEDRIKEVIQIQEKLHGTYGRNRRKAAIGIYPFEKIKLPIKFEARKADEIRFQPLEAPELMTANQILSKHPAGVAYGYLLEGKPLYPIFIDADNQILSMPPIINSEITGKVTTKTKDVFIECSGFEFDVLSKCLNIIVTALADMGGMVYEMTLKYPKKTLVTPNLEPEEMKLDLAYVNKILGLDLEDADVKRHLAKMGYDYDKGKALVPAYRADVLHQIDLVEDIAIAYGYDKFKEEMPNVGTIAEESNFEVFKRKIANILVGFGFVETNTYNLTNEENLTSKMNVKIENIGLSNAKNEGYTVLRSWMIPSLFTVLNNNKHHEYPQRIFEMGTVFKKDLKSETGTSEFTRLAVAISNTRSDFTNIKQIFDALLRMLNVEYEFVDTEHGSFIPGRVARVNVKGKGVAYIGEIHPSVIDVWTLEMPVSVFELNLTDLYNLINS